MPFVDYAKKKAYMKKYWAEKGYGSGPLKLNVQVDDVMLAGIKAMAARDNASISEIVRTYIEWGLENDTV